MPEAVPSEAGIWRLLRLFHTRVRQDVALGPTDEDRARIGGFSSSAMLRSGQYQMDPFSTHLRQPDLEPTMFDRALACAFRERADLFERLPAR